MVQNKQLPPWEPCIWLELFWCSHSKAAIYIVCLREHCLNIRTIVHTHSLKWKNSSLLWFWNIHFPISSRGAIPITSIMFVTVISGYSPYPLRLFISSFLCLLPNLVKSLSYSMLSITILISMSFCRPTLLLENCNNVEHFSPSQSWMQILAPNFTTWWSWALLRVCIYKTSKWLSIITTPTPLHLLVSLYMKNQKLIDLIAGNKW